MNRYEAILEAYRMLLINLEYNTEPKFKNGLLKVDWDGNREGKGFEFKASLKEVEEPSEEYEKYNPNDFGGFNFCGRINFLKITEDTYKKIEESKLFEEASEIKINLKSLAESLMFLGMKEQEAYIMASVAVLHKNYLI